MGVRDIYRDRESLGHLPVLRGQTLIETPYRLQLDASTIGLWNFSEGIGVYALDLVGGHAGTITGATWGTTGPWGSGLTFDATDDNVVLSTNEIMARLVAGTVEMVVGALNPSPPAVANSFWTEIAAEGSWAFYRASDDTLSAGSYNGGVWKACSSAALTWSRTANFYIALAWDGTNSQWYVNGVPSGNAGDPLQSSSAPNINIRIGFRANNTFPLDGNIYSIRCSNAKRSAAEILTNAKLMGFA